MGIDMISNTAASYGTTPKEIMPKIDVGDNSGYIQSGTQKIVETETRAVNNIDSNDSGDNNSQNWLKDEQSKEQKVKSAVSDANKKARKARTECEFKYHEETKRISISIKNSDTGEVIKEIPPEKTLDMIEKMWEMAGLFVDDKR